MNSTKRTPNTKLKKRTAFTFKSAVKQTGLDEQSDPTGTLVLTIPTVTWGK